MSSEVNLIYNVVVVLGLELVAQGCGSSVSDAPAKENTTGNPASGAGGGPSTAGVDSSAASTDAGVTSTTASSASATVTSSAGGATTSTTSTDGIALSDTTGANTGGSGGAPPGPEDLPCPASQWSCEVAICSRSGFSDAMDCSCDPERPASEDDCRADERFVCNQYGTDEGAIPFSCLCVPSDTDCYTACSTIDPLRIGVPSSITPDCTTRTVFCDCAYAVILK